MGGWREGARKVARRDDITVSERVCAFASVGIGVSMGMGVSVCVCMLLKNRVCHAVGHRVDLHRNELAHIPAVPHYT